jgi:RNA polymerase sigma factor (sigma-70 family)
VGQDAAVGLTAVPAKAEIEAKLRSLKPLCKSIAVKLQRSLSLPEHVTFDELVQAGMIGAWQALERFDGRGKLEGFAAIRIRGAMVDFLRSSHPVGRNGPEVSFVSIDHDGEDDHQVMQIASDEDHATELERRQLAQQRLRSLTSSQRSVVSEVLEGKMLEDIGAKRGYSGGRASQVVKESVDALNNAKNRTPDSFDPSTVRIKIGAKIPSPQRKYRNRFRELIDRMPATGSVELAPTPAASLIAEFKKAGIPYCRRTLDNGLVQVTREPSPEQFEE